ncbi:MAG TPA: alpha-ketoglutarate-dependent dioxygenase AlkB [Gaiellaceae bacterium]|nr:alpha-ketoglutarate-dependent dioxygenase AlkB [Gaiellaceae bacterium]
MARRETIEERPEGLVYRPDFVTEDEERDLLARMEAIDFREVVMHGQPAKRTVRHYGLDYGYESWSLSPADPLPPELTWVRDRCAELADVEPDELAQVLVSRYPPGAGIGWHRDAPMFGAAIVGVSLAAPCRMRFQRTAGDVRRVFALELEPRSAYVLAGQARSAWQHSIPATKALRYSLTFRTLRNPERWRR